MHVIWVELTNVTLLAWMPSNLTPETPVKLVPKIVTFVLPNQFPLGGLTLESVGAGVVLYVNSALAGLVPPGVVTSTLQEPTDPAGTTHSSPPPGEVRTEVAAVPLKVTLLTF